MGDCVSLNRCNQERPPFQNPLFIPEIISLIFKYLEIEDIKNCCIVHRSWNSIGEPMLEKKLRIPSETRASRKYLKRFANSFPINKTGYSPMRLYHIKNEELINYKAQLNVNIFDNFMKSRFEDMMELTLYKINVSDDSGKVLPVYFVNSVIIGRNMRKLKVIGTNLTTLVISMDAIANLNVLTLQDCQLDVNNKRNPKRRVSLEEIDLKGVNFIEQGQPLKFVTVNKIFDFTCTKNLYVDSEYSASKMELDMSDASAAKLNCVYLSGVQLHNWEICDWNLSKLTLAKTCVKTTYSGHIKKDAQHIKIKELEFIMCSDIDSSFLPLNLQKLILGPGCQIKFDKNLANTKNCFSHLKYLCVSHTPNIKQQIYFHDN